MGFAAVHEPAYGPSRKWRDWRPEQGARNVAALHITRQQIMARPFEPAWRGKLTGANYRRNKDARNRITKAAAIKLLVIVNIGFSACASAQDINVGKIQYQSSCAASHGADARGDGPVSNELKTRPADLTVLAKNNDSVFAYDRVYQMIDGRNSTVARHGTREMPIWGYRFGSVQAYRFKARVLAVIDYLKSIQQQ